MPIDQGTTLGSDRAPAASAMTPREFARWWATTLSGMLPACLKAAFVPNRNWVIIRRDGNTFTVYSENGLPVGSLADNASARSKVRSGDVLALLSPDEAFLRQRRLPATSEQHMRNAMRLQIAADTPFELDEVHDDCRVIAGAEEGGQLLAEQALVKRTLIAELVAMAAAERIDLAGVDVAGPDGAPIGFNLLPESQRARSDAFLPQLNRGLALGALALAALTGTLSLMSMGRKLATLERETDAVRAEAASVLELQRQAMARVETIRMIEQRSASPVRFTTLLDEIAAALPEDSWLEALAYDGKQISLVGLSRSSDGLISKLESIRGVAGARVVSSMMRDDRLEADRFRIELLLESDVIATPSFDGEDNG
ncbi:MAG: PilN domain-containing protein [Alphaproteobacteria bacterium]|nr:PilN domain-containing protein [Alphaproteobacteria bacterium]